MIENDLKKNYVTAIDIGTNSIHAIIASVDANGEMNVVAREKDSVRLGRNMKQGIISDAAIDDAITALKKIQEISESYSSVIKAVATSAVREAANKYEFIGKVKDETGIDINIISGEEEGLLIYKGVSSAFSISDKKSLIIDIGGGSTEIILAENGEIKFIDSLKLGAIRTSNEFFEDFKTSKKSIEKCKKHISKVMDNTVTEIEKIGYDVVIGASGTIQALGRIVLSFENNETPVFINGISINSVKFHELFYDIEKLSKPSKRALLPGIDLSRAEIITAGELIFQNFLKKLFVPKVLISSYSLREGIIIDTFEKIKIEN